MFELLADADVAVPLVLGAVVAGLVAGLTGFGTALVALGIWLHVLEPHVAVPLAALSGSTAHVIGITHVARTVETSRVIPFVAAGLVGIPLGLTVLVVLDPTVFRQMTGIIMTGLAVTLLASTVAGRRRRGTPVSNEPISRVSLLSLGFIGGVLGGAAGLSGALPALYAQLRRWPKLLQRGLFQVYNLATLTAAVIAHIANGLFNSSVIAGAVVVLPACVLGAVIGRRLFEFVDELTFRRVVLVLLTGSGLRLLLAG